MRTITVRRSLLILLVSFSLVPVAVIATAGYLVTERMTDRLVARHNRTLAEQARTRAEGLFDKAEAICTVLSDLETFRRLESREGRLAWSEADRAELERTFRGILEVHPEFMNLLFGAPAPGNEFFMVGHRKDGVAVLRTVLDPEGNPRTYWGSSADTAPVSYEATPLVPEARDWFGAALGGDAAQWSRPYVFKTSRKPGVTVSRRVTNARGETLGVLGVDLSLEDLSKYLSEFELGVQGTAFALSVQGDVVAWAEENRVLAVGDSSSPALAKVESIDDPRFPAEIEALVKEGKEEFVHKAGGEKYYTQLVPFRRGPISWAIGVTAPRSHFTAGLDFLRLFTVGVAVLTGVVAAFLAFFLANRVTPPLEALAHRAGRVREGRLEATEEDASIDTPIQEIQELDRSFDHMVDGLHELFVTRRYISGATRAMITQRTGRHIADHDVKGTKTEATVLFADIRGFTTFSEKHPPEVVIEVLNRYLSLQSDSIHAHGGVVDKFIGDAVMALFLGPDREVPAVRSALEIQKGIAAINETRRAEGQDAVEVGIGIHSGLVLMGDIGSETRTDYSAIGDVVNVASRLQDLARGGQIVVSKTIADAIGLAFEMEWVEEIQVKGRQTPIGVYRVRSGQAGC